VRSENRPLAVIAILLAVSILITGALAVRLTLARRSEGADQATMLAEARIAFVSDREGQGAVYVMDADGSDLNQISGSNQFALFPAWSPDGERVAYLVFERMGRAGQVWVAAADGSERVQVAVAAGAQDAIFALGGDQTPREMAYIDEGWPEQLAWSPDGRHLAVITGQEETVALQVAVVETGAITTVLEREGALTWPSWSPDGERLLFTSIEPGRRQDSYLPYGELWQYTVSTGELEELVVGEGFDGLGVWSP
jgi:Tol biopolymer transport system component